MKRTTSLAMLVLLSATACGTDERTATDSPAKVDSSSEESESVEESEAPDAPTTTQAEEEDVVTQVEEEEDPLESVLNERGNIPMPENSPAGINDIDSAEAIVEWSASDVNKDVNCSNWIGQEADGLLLSIDFEVEAFDRVTELGQGGYSFPRFSFHIVDSDGQVVTDNTHTGSAINCISSEVELPHTELRAGQSAQGTLVFESPIESGFLVHHDYYTDSYYEWEF